MIRIEDEINQLNMSRPHVVILGAGASIASCPNGDKNGIILPSMQNFVKTLNFKDYINPLKKDFRSMNFEDFYNFLTEKEEYKNIRKELEKNVYDYFDKIKIPREPTIYDYLLLSLRKKDIIATFNWDPLIVEAYYRNKKFELPELVILHGNVRIGYCKKHNKIGLPNIACPICNEPLEPIKLLYPIKEKNYGADGFISKQWERLHDYLEHAFMITIFGYSAPKSDSRAIEIMKNAWGKLKDRNLEQIELINLISEDELINTWKEFIHTHHYDIHNDFFDSWIAKHPRRTGEAFYNQYMLGKIIEDNPIPKKETLIEIWNWIQELLKVERENT